MISKIRALDKIEKQGHPWESFNTIFGDHTSVMDDIFNRGVRSNLESYVPHKENFEQQFCKQQLSPLRASNTHRVHVLVGQVGRGKSTFVDYCRKVKLKELFGDRLLQIFIDTQSFKVKKTKQTLENETIEYLEELIIDRFFKNEAEFCFKFVRWLGYQEKAASEITAIYKNRKSIKFLFKFLEHLKKENQNIFEGLLIIIDNIDENPKEVIKSADFFVKNLIRKGDQVVTTFPITVLVTVRDYNANAFFHTDRTNNTHLRNVEEHKVVYNKVKTLKKKIKLNSEFPNFTDTINYFIRVDKRFDLKNKIIVIKNNEIIDFLEDFSEMLFKSKDNKTIELLRTLSAGNLKFLVANIFNILHSNKLPLSLLFTKHFIPDEYKKYNEIEEPFKIDIVLECLLSIHFPFYSKKESHIMNIFNCTNSNGPKDYVDMLVIPRLLLLLNNTSSKTKNELINSMSKYGYNSKVIFSALVKGFNYGLFETLYGVKASHLDPKKTKIVLSSIGKAYINKLINNVVYLQYICEDTYLPASHIVEVTEKYPVGNASHGSKKLRIESAYKLWEFIGIMEKLEKDYIENSGKSYSHFLDLMGFKTLGKNITIYEFISPEINQIYHSISYEI